MNKDTQTLISQLENQVAQLSKDNQQLITQVNKTNLLHEVSVSLASALDFETIVTTAVGFSKYLGASSGEIHLLTDTGEVYFKSTYPERNDINNIERQALVRRVLKEGLDSWVLETGQLALVLDTLSDERWLPVEYSDQTVSVRSAICAPIITEQRQLKGAISFVHPNPHHFDQQDLNLLGTLTNYIVNALENAYQVTDIETSLRESHLMLDISRHLSGTSSIRDIQTALLHSVSIVEANHYILLTCQGLSSNNLPTHAKIVGIGNLDNPDTFSDMVGFRFALDRYPAMLNLILNQEILVVEDVEVDEQLTRPEQEMLEQLGCKSLVINPLISRIRVVGLLIVARDHPHIFSERELAILRTIGNQTTLALEHVRQIEHTEQALTETQTLYRAGRVLAGAGGQQQILEEALFEFVYSLGLDQGGVVMLTPDRDYGELVAYMEHGDLRPTEKLNFRIDESIPYQEVLLSGQPFVSIDFTNDTKIVEFENFNKTLSIKSILQAPIIMRGETIGWIGADAVREARDFSQREVDMARAMADQISIAIQNRRLLEQSQRRAEQLRAVATVGKAVTGLTDLNEILRLTVNLIRDSFGFYHVSIFLIDNARKWAVVKASTGEVGKIMVERPHKLGVGSNSIVGYVSQYARPRIALDVGQDAVHFNNPLLPGTHSEMGLPLISRGLTIGVLDVQSEVVNAFSDEDVETLQVVADQLTTAIDTARLFEETQRRLRENATLYSIGTKIGETLDLQKTATILAEETAHMLNVAECVITLLEDNDQIHIITDFVRPGSQFRSDQGQTHNIADFAGLVNVFATKHEVIINADDEGGPQSWERDYLLRHNGSTLALVPILLRNQVIGTLEVFDDQPGRRFTENEISLLDSVALLAANAIENARLFTTAQESQTFMKSIIDQIPDPIFIKDRQHKWVVVNNSYTRTILGQPEENVIGKNEYDFQPATEAERVWQHDHTLFETGQTQEMEETATDLNGNTRIYYSRRVPLSFTNDDTPDYLIGIIQDITERKQREQEREQLIEETRLMLERTQTLYRVSNILAASTERRETFEQVLGEYLKLLGLSQGSIMLYNPVTDSNEAQARYIDNRPVEPRLALPAETDQVFQQLRQRNKPLVIDNPTQHPYTKAAVDSRGRQNVTAMLFIPLLIRGQLVGSLVVDALAPNHKFSPEDTESGVVIADQLTIWLENHQLLQEAHHRSESLQTAADVSRAASSILNINQLIDTSVNLIRDQFNFYYVGLFMIEGDWAVLKAGTGEAGKIQLARNHRLAVGGESMIGWCIANRQARIALDVGEEAVHFRNPVLPDTRSEMALPLINRDLVLGALTVQSTQRLAFSNEDITLLQTMADQLANAITNANLFTQTQEALAEAEALYTVTQAMASARNDETVFRLAIDSLTGAGVDTTAIYIYQPSGSGTQPSTVIELKAAWSQDGQSHLAPGTRFNLDDFVFKPILPNKGYTIIEDIPNNPDINQALRTTLQNLNITALLAIPLATQQQQFGVLMATYRHKPDNTFSKNQLRYCTTVAQQMVTALENLRLLDDSQRRARREQIIREISGKIRSADNVNDILKTTVTEVSKLVGASRGQIVLGQPAPANGDSGGANGHQANPGSSEGQIQ